MANKLCIRLIPEILRLDGPTTMAAHEFLTTLNKPALLISHFEPGTVTYGKRVSFDSLPELCKSGTLPFVRRETGGEILYHDPKDITYGFAAIPESSKLDITRAMLLVMSWLMDGLDSLGMRTLTNLDGSIFVKEANGYRKIGGNAVKKDVKKSYLIHGSIFYDQPDFPLLEKVYGVDMATLRKVITCVREHKAVPVERVYEAIRHGFSKDGRTFIEEPFNEEEWSAIRELANKYRSIEHSRGRGKTGKVCAATWTNERERRRFMPPQLDGRTIYD